MRPSDADVQIEFPDGNVETINMLRMLVHTQNAQMKAKYGMFLPNVGKLHPTVAALRDEYHITARTWADAAEQMSALYDAIKAELDAMKAEAA